MAEAMTILITRAMPEASVTARQVCALGHHPILSPLQRCERLSPALPEQKPERLIATSARAFHPHSLLPQDWRALPLHVVGAATARAAREAGFTHLLIAGGDAQSLIRDVMNEAEAGSHLLYMAGEPRKADVEAALGERFRLETRLHYRMVGVQTLTEATKHALETGRCHAILHGSAEAARLFITLTKAAGLVERLMPIRHLCLSPAIAQVLEGAGLPFSPRLTIAEKPDMASLLARLS